MRFYRWCVLLSILTACVTILPAQENNVGTIRGSVIDDSTDRPIEFVNVLLCMNDDTSIVAGKVTDQRGGFDFSGVPAGEYFVRFSMVGY